MFRSLSPLVLMGATCMLPGCGGGNDGASGQPGTNGSSALIAMGAEPAGSNCANGGTQVMAGLDTNGNGQLDPDEVSQIQHVCTGSTGAAGAAGATGAEGSAGTAGAPGATGPAGADGATGPSGANGHGALLSLSSETAGGNCVHGGTRIDAGVDTNDDGVLQPGEISSTGHVCNASAAWSVMSDDTQAASNSSYLASSDSRLKLTLPPSPQVGDIIAISGAGAGGWELAPNAGQSIGTATISAIAVQSAAAQIPLYGAQYASMQLQYIGDDQFMPLSYTGSITNGYLSQGGLVWSPANVALPWNEAKSYCDGTINGSTGWRLPTQGELHELVSSGQQYTGGWTIRFTWTADPDAPGHWGVKTDGSGEYPFDDTYDGSVTCVK